MFNQRERWGRFKIGRRTDQYAAPDTPARSLPDHRLKPLFSTTILALSGIVLSSCVSTTSDQMYGYSPAEPVLTETALSETDNQFPETSVNPDSAASSPDNTLAEGSRSEETITALAPAQTTQASIDALNVGITQTANANPGGNLYSLKLPDSESATTVPIPGTSPRNDTAATPVDAPAAPTELAALPSTEPTASETVQAETVATIHPAALAEPPKKKSFFGRIFNSSTTPKKNVPVKAKTTQPESLRNDIRVSRASASGNAGLPGVRLSSLFEIKIGNDEDGENAAGVELASAGGLARLAPGGLHIQTERVDITCFKPQLVRLIKKIENHYGRPAIITSGFRSPRHNRKIGGARNSRHTSCEAADIQVEGVSKWNLAAYVRSMPDRGGVGTYCHTESVHVDIGTERDWNWRCRRRKK